MKKYFCSLLLIFFLFSCSKQEKALINKDRISIGTFNMEWLGDGNKDRIDRTEDDYKKIAEIIKDTEVDILGIQEIENEQAIKRVLKYLPDYDFYLGTHGHAQNVGLLYKNNLDIKLIGDYFPIAVESRKTRPGLLFQLNIGNFESLMMVVHFKSSSHYDDTEQKADNSREIRLRQASKLSFWIDSVLNAGQQSNIIVVGDFNDSPLRKEFNTLEPLYTDSNIKFLTDSLKGCKYRNWYVIDHIIVSQSAFKRVMSNSLRLYDIYSTTPKNQLEKISDHCPVIVDFNIQSQVLDSGVAISKK